MLRTSKNCSNLQSNNHFYFVKYNYHLYILMICCHFLQFIVFFIDSIHGITKDEKTICKEQVKNTGFSCE